MGFHREPAENEYITPGKWLTTTKSGHTDTLYSQMYRLGEGARYPERWRQMKAVLQADGNLVVYCCRDSNQTAVWSSNTSYRGVAPYTLSIDHQANVVIRDSQASEIWRVPHRRPIEQQPCRLVMQNDGNLVLYDATNHPIWASDTAGKYDA